MSNNVGGIRFCPECNNMMKPIEGNSLNRRGKDINLRMQVLRLPRAGQGYDRHRRLPHFPKRPKDPQIRYSV